MKLSLKLEGIRRPASSYTVGAIQHTQFDAGDRPECASIELEVEDPDAVLAAVEMFVKHALSARDCLKVTFPGERELEGKLDLVRSEADKKLSEMRRVVADAQERESRTMRRVEDKERELQDFREQKLEWISRVARAYDLLREMAFLQREKKMKLPQALRVRCVKFMNDVAGPLAEHAFSAEPEEEVRAVTKRVVLHLQRVIETRTYRNTYSLCGRNRTTKDGMNLTDDRSKVTCRLCRKRMAMGW